MNRKTTLFIIAVLVAASGASARIKSGIMATGVEGHELCVVENPEVEPKFVDVMLRVVHARGYQTRMVHAIAECPISMTFTATYARARYGTVSVLKSSRFLVYRDAKDIAEVSYRYTRNMFVNGTVEEVVTTMVERLLPKSRQG